MSEASCVIRGIIARVAVDGCDEDCAGSPQIDQRVASLNGRVVHCHVAEYMAKFGLTFVEADGLAG